MRKRIAPIALAIILIMETLAVTAAASEFNASPTVSTVFVNGRRAELDAYNINNSNYVKLRDLAFALSGTEKQFEVEWDAASNSIILTSGRRYTAVGGEMSGRGRSDRTAEPSAARIVLDGADVNFRAYVIGGSNYFRLRDAGQALNFSVEWDGARNTINIDTSAEYVSPTRLAETGDMGQDYLDSIIFLGDSTTYALQAYGVLTGGRQTRQVWTPANRTFSLFNQRNITILYPDTGENLTVERAAALKRPAYMVITLGINGVSSMTEENFKRDYRALITRIQEASPETGIILNSIYPVARIYRSISNERIDLGNTWIYELAEEMGLRYLDTASALKDEEGYLPHAYQNGDGLHLSPEALRVVADYVRTHGYR